eukprot:gene26828-4423_t
MKPNESASDDDDAPEEIALTSGKAAAEEKRTGEAEARAAELKKLKDKRTEGHAKRREQKEKKIIKETRAATLAKSQAAALEEVELLDPSILSALETRKGKQKGTVKKIDVGKVKGKKDMKRTMEIQKGPVVVEVLNPRKKLQGSGADAANYMKERLLGGGTRKRSYDMLCPATGSAVKPAAKIV